MLLDGPQRTSELEKRIVGISQKVLIEQLRALEEHGVVSRRPSAGDSQGGEYLLTPLGESFRPLLDSLIEWGAHHAEELHEADRILPCQAVVRNSPRTAAGADGVAEAMDKETARPRK